MAHVALYRKYRSQTFDDLVGQDHVVRTLRNAIAQGKIGHAYLFTGPRGTGKTSTARLLAKAVNCTDGPSPEPREDDPICISITNGSCMDVIEIDAASESGVDKVRESIVEASEYRPAECRYKVFIIDEVHDLSAKGFDALLKTIEEPPGHVIFVLATTEAHKVPPTVRSRCQRFEFYRGTVHDLVSRLTHVVKSEGIEAEPAALHAIARMADGGYRDALTLLEQAMLTADGQVTRDHVYTQLGLVADDQADALLEAMAQGDVAGTVTGLEAMYLQGRDPRAILESLLYRLSDLTRAAYHVNVGASNDGPQEAGLAATAGRFGADRLLELRSAVAEAHKDIRDISLPRLWLEAELVRIGQVVKAGPTRNTVAAAPAARAAVSPVAVPSSPEPRESPRNEPVPTPNVEPAVVKTREPNSPDDAVWQTIVAEISAQSKTAAARLPKSSVGSVADGQVTIEFERISDADWVREKGPLVKAIAAAWRDKTGKDAAFQFVVAQGRPAPKPPRSATTTTVESPLEGDRLYEAARDILLGNDERGAKPEPGLKREDNDETA
ncbi:MAG: DNA polymerase III subunit gamma/tau [Fimbriimonadaceae bacterium]|nr:DNA polymerase III subunit gamma/tau [Fimbriimonadaceae bacterium]